MTCVNQLDPEDHEQIWSWDGAVWTLVSDEGPPPLVVTAAAWDSARNVLVRYGGLPMGSNDCVAETWEWDDEWRQVTTAADPHPTACDHMKLAYDEASGMTVLVGGGKLQDLSPETWGWDGEAWSLLGSDGPAPRAHHGFAADPARDRLLLYGGIDNTSIFQDIWSWSDGAWTRLEGLPGERSHMGWASSPDATLLIDGATGNRTFNTLNERSWFYGIAGWQETLTSGPGPRGSPALAWNPIREVWVLYGGFDATGAELGDTWEFDGATWSCVSRC